MSRVSRSGRIVGLATVGAVAVGLLCAPAGAVGAGTSGPTWAGGRGAVAADSPSPDQRNVGLSPCDTVPGDLSGYRPGDLIAATEIAPTDPSDLSNARSWRILYVTTGIDETQVQAVCGTVVAPADGDDLRPQVVAWAHGTMGVHQTCMPSTAPDAYLYGQTAAGIGAVAYGSGAGAVTGDPEDGILQSLVNDGRLVTASDYYAGAGAASSVVQPYALGVPSGAAVLDSVRAGIALVGQQLPGTPTGSTWELVTFGHSQGGHAAFWAGQLASDYFRLTTPTGGEPPITLVGVAAEAPASSFVAEPGTPQRLVGRHLGDLEMHQPAASFVDGFVRVGVIGPLLFSFVAQAWDQYADLEPAPGARFPARPAGVDPARGGLLTVAGMATADIISGACLIKGKGVVDAAVATMPYALPGKAAFFRQPMWGIGWGNQFTGRLDQTCLSASKSTQMSAWCQWLWFNMPGPDGVNGFDAIPTGADGTPADVYIAQGMNDEVIHCIATGATVPDDTDCLSVQLYESLEGARGGDVCEQASVSLDLWQAEPGSPATHFSIPGQAADNGDAGFPGSRLDRFMNQAFKGSADPGCEADVVN